LNKSELIAAIAAKANLSKADAGRALDAVTETISETVATGDAVALIGFGTFKRAERAARQGKNPKTGVAMDIPASKVPRFVAGATFKTKVAGAK
jgi:DNA-binding protein HU-beta